jgi:hypothetical protein
MNGNDCGCNAVQSSLQTKKIVSTNQPLNTTVSPIDGTNCAGIGEIHHFQQMGAFCFTLLRDKSLLQLTL